MTSALLSLLGAVLVLAGAWGWGCLVWRGRAPGPVWALAAGAPLLSLGLFALLALHFASPPLAILWCLTGIAAGVWKGRTGWNPGHPPLWTLPIVAAYGVLYAVYALAPEIEPDAAGYHLGLVAEWLRTGGFAARIGFYELLPLGVETLFLPAVAVGGYPAAKVVHLAFVPATAPLMLQLARRLELPEWTGWAGWLLYALSPVTGVSGTAAYTDAAGVFFTTAAFAALLEWRATRETRWLVAAGLAAGFCYAVKLPGALIAAAAVCFVMLHRNWRAAGVVAAAALTGAAPWIGRALWLTGNPVAPLGNRIFPNPHFHEWTEQYLTQFLRDYGVSGWASITHSLLLDGTALQGLLGAAWIFTPLALFAARRPGARWLLGAAAVSALPWLANAGARFLMPALPFFGMALAAALPRPLAVALVGAHAIASWPAVVDLYAGTEAWRLREWPWGVVRRDEPAEAYLRRRLWDYRVAEMVRAHVRADEPLLDLYGLPTAYTGVVGIGSLPSVPYDQMAETLARAAANPPESLDVLSCAFPLEFLRAVRWELTDGFAAPWSIREVRFHYEAYARPVSRSWLLRAWPSPQDAALACDLNLATGWHTWRPAPRGSRYEVRFGRPQPLSSIEAVMPYLRGGQLRPRVEGLRLNGEWKPLCGRRSVEPMTSRPMRREAVALLRHRGIRWIVVTDSEDGHGPIGRAIAMAPEAWDLEEAAKVETVRLFRLRD